MMPIHKRKRRVPKHKTSEPSLPKHVQRKYELSKLHDIPIEDIFVDSKNGVELYRNPSSGGWVSNPIYRDVE